GGIIKENTATTTNAGSGGGAVSVSYLSSTSFAMKGVAKIPYGGAEKSNDVFLEYIAGGSVSAEKQAFIKISGALSAGSGATMTMKKWQRGKQFLGVGGDLTALPDGVMGKFDFTDLGWEKELYKVSADNDAARINAPIYVASETESQRAYTHAAPSDAAGTNGNSYHPFKTIKAACSVMDDPTQEYTIQIDGEIKGCQVLPATLLKAKNSSDPAGSNYAKKVNLQSASDQPKGSETTTGGVINANVGSTAQDNGSALSVNTAVPVAIQRLTISGGNTTGNGGGINAAADSLVFIGDKSVIKGNKAGASGGGVYIASGATVCVQETVVIGNKDASADTVGSTEISTGANVAVSGGGIYNLGTLRLGFAYDTGSMAIASNIKILGNTATGTETGNGGGGLFTAYNAGSGVLQIADSDSCSYNIKYNCAALNGGGINLQNNKTTTIGKNVSLVIEGNKAANGGGIYNGSGKTIEIPKNCSIISNVATEKGGGICNYGTALNFTNSGGTISVAKNQAKLGGGIYAGGTGAANYKVTLQYGTIGGSGTGTEAQIAAAIADGANTATEAGGAVYADSNTSTYCFAVKSGGNATIPPAYDASGSCVNKNDVYLKRDDANSQLAKIYIDGTSLPTGFEAAITPGAWKRGTVILKSGSNLAQTVIDKFKMSQDNADWKKSPDASDQKQAYIMMPVYVASSAETDDTRKHCASAPASGNAGTPSAPYARISDAIAEAAASGADIVIDGTLSSERQYIGGSGVTADLQIRGYKETDATPSAAKLARSLTDATTNGNVLYIDTDKVVTITNLEISGGRQKGDGGGILVANASGKVNLGNGVVIKSNLAEENPASPGTGCGGGVYVAAGAKLGVYGTAVIGNSGAEDAPAATGVPSADNGINKAEKGGGIYNDSGSVYLGCAINPGGTIDNSSARKLTGGVYGNAATSDGGGIYAGGMTSIGGGSGGGNIKFNSASNGGGIYCANTNISASGIDLSGNEAANGGGVYVAADKKITLTSVQKIYSNTATANGGAVYDAGTLVLNSSTIGQKDSSGTLAPNTAATHGGAVYVESGAAFQMAYSACVLPVRDSTKEETATDRYYVPKQNDVFLAKSSDGSERAAITVTADLSATAPVAALTPEESKRGLVVVKGSYLKTGTNAMFATTEYDDEWNKKQASDNKSVTLESDVYVASSATTDTTRKYCSAAPASGNNGTKRKPYKNISSALAVFNDADAAAKVIVDGTLSGAQTIGTATAKSITVQGYTYTSGSDTKSDAVLNGGYTSSSKGTTLTINASDVNSVTVQYLAITGGYAASNGGGVYVKSGSV
ncbi:MAG: hypothetical protein II814_09310, partial [Treponema sp.]|nr:hypothetical protein [Treponema sp.]